MSEDTENQDAGATKRNLAAAAVATAALWAGFGGFDKKPEKPEGVKQDAKELIEPNLLSPDVEHISEPLETRRADSMVHPLKPRYPTPRTDPVSNKPQRTVPPFLFDAPSDSDDKSPSSSERGR